MKVKDPVGWHFRRLAALCSAVGEGRESMMAEIDLAMKEFARREEGAAQLGNELLELLVKYKGLSNSPRCVEEAADYLRERLSGVSR